MVDIGDLKSPGRKAVRVRVPLAPPPSTSPFRANPQRPLSNPEDFIFAVFGKVSWLRQTPLTQETR